MLKFRELLERILKRLIPAENFVLESYTVYSGSVSSYKGSTYNITKSNYYPLTISGFSSDVSGIIPYRVQLQSQANDSGQIVWALRNTSSTSSSVNFIVYVLWVKVKDNVGGGST